MNQKTVVAILARASGLDLPANRLEALVPALERLQCAVNWVDEAPLGFTEPALIFDAQAWSLY